MELRHVILTDDLLFILHLLSRWIQKKYTKLCLCIQDLTQHKPVGPSGMGLCSCLNSAQTYPADWRAFRLRLEQQLRPKPINPPEYLATEI